MGYRLKIKGRVRTAMAVPLVLASIGWLVSLVFLSFWLFDVGHGPLNESRVGSAGEWVSGLGTAAAVAITLSVLIHDRRERMYRVERERLMAQIEKRSGKFMEEMELTFEAEAKVPIVGKWYRLPGETGGNEGHYRIELEVYNGLDRPMNELTATLRLTGDWVGDDHDNKPWPGSVVLCANRIVPPGTTYKYEMERGASFKLPVDRVDAGGYLAMSWQIGEYTYDWSRFASKEKGSLLVRGRRRASDDASGS